MVSKQKILIVDDDNNIAELISLYLTKECFDTMIVNDGESVMPAMETFAPNLILLDLMLPGIDGYQVCREVRAQYSVPIIMLSAKGEVFDKVLGLELGADDYMEKPFDSKELVARAKAVLRRYKPSNTPTENSNDKCVEYADLTINLTNYSVIYMGHTVEMPPKELELLYFLSGAMNISVIPVPWMCISSVFVRRSRIMPTGRSAPSGALAINSKYVIKSYQKQDLL